MRKGFTLIELMIVVAIIAIIAAIAIPSLLRSRIAANETAAVGTLKQITSHEASIRQTDGDGNGVKDYWTLDVVGFYALIDVQGNAMKYVDIQVAKADFNAFGGGAMPANAPAAADYGTWAAMIPPEAKSGYHYAALVNGWDPTPAPGAAFVYCSVPDTSPNNGVIDPYNNRSAFGFVAMPAFYGREGVRVFIVNEEGVIYGVDNGDTLTSPLGDYITLGAGGADTWPASDPTTDNTCAGGRFWMVSN